MLPRTAGSSASKMPTRSNSQFMLPSVFGWISELIGSFWPDLPAEALGQALAGDGAGARLAKASRCVGGDRELRVHVEVALRVHREDREGVALVLVLGAEPVRVGHAHHARHLLDAAQVARSAAAR